MVNGLNTSTIGSNRKILFQWGWNRVLISKGWLDGLLAIADKIFLLWQGTGKGSPVTCQVDRGKIEVQLYSFTTLALEEGGGQDHTLATLFPGKRPSSHSTRAGWPLGVVWIGPESLANTRIRTLDRPGCSDYTIPVASHNVPHTFFIKLLIFLIKLTTKTLEWKLNAVTFGPQKCNLV
jgi:hypothetical protein